MDQSGTWVKSIIAIAILVWLVDVFVVHDETNTHTENNRDSNERYEVPSTQIKKALEREIVLEDIILPRAPVMMKQTQHQQQAQKNNIDRQRQTDIEHQRQPNTHSVNIEQHDANTASTAHIYTDINTDENLSIELMLPQSENKRQQMLTHLYRCEGMQFGVLNANSTDINMLSKSSQIKPSEWLRITSGGLGRREKLLYQAGNIKGQTVRIFPKRLDAQLSSYIAMHLKGKGLHSFKGQYALIRGNLSITHITINQLPIPDIWTLSHKTCSL